MCFFPTFLFYTFFLSCRFSTLIIIKGFSACISDFSISNSISLDYFSVLYINVTNLANESARFFSHIHDSLIMYTIFFKDHLINHLRPLSNLLDARNFWHTLHARLCDRESILDISNIELTDKKRHEQIN